MTNNSDFSPVYAIGDIHGQLSELQRVLDLVEKDGGKDAKVVFLGDYTDRGPESRGVIDLLIDGQKAGRNWTFIKGNHDQMFQLFLQSPPQHDPYLPTELYWLHPRLGGDTTMASYGVISAAKTRVKLTHAEALEAVPQTHLEFLGSLELGHTHGEFFFCHAGIRPNVALEDQTEEDLIWIRQEFHDFTDPHPKIIVHGHTPVDLATHYRNRINLDTGAGYGRPLTTALFEDKSSWVLTSEGRLPLEPVSGS